MSKAENIGKNSNEMEPYILEEMRLINENPSTKAFLLETRKDNNETLLYIAIKKNLPRVAQFLLSLDVNPTYLLKESTSSSSTSGSFSRHYGKKNILGLIVRQSKCDGSIFKEILQKREDVYKTLRYMVCQNIQSDRDYQDQYVKLLKQFIYYHLPSANQATEYDNFVNECEGGTIRPANNLPIL